MKYFIHDRSLAHLCVYVMFALLLLSSASEVSAYSYSQSSYYTQGSYSYYSQGSYYTQGSYSYYSQSSYSNYSQSSYSNYSQSSYSYYSQSSYSSSNGSGPSWQELQDFASGGSNTQEKCTWLCGVVKAVSDGVLNTPKAVTNAGKAVVDAVNGALGIKPLPSYTTLPSGNTGDKPETIKSGNEPTKNTSGSNANTSNTGSDNSGTVTTVTKPDVFTDNQEKARAAAKQAGLNVDSPAIEAVVMITLEKYNGDITKTINALKDVPNDAITNEVAFGRTGCSANDSQCAAADKVRSILGLDAGAYQQKLAQEMQAIGDRRNADPIVTVTNTEGSRSDDTGSGPSWQELQDFANSGDTKKDDVGSGPSWQELQDFANSGDKSNTTPFTPDLTGLLGPGIPMTLTPPKVTNDLFTNEDFKDVKISVYDESRVVTVPAKKVKAFDVYDTEKVTVNPAVYSFVSDEEYNNSTLSTDTFTKVKQDLKAIIPNPSGVYQTVGSEVGQPGLPIMSPGELALIGKFDLSRGGRFDPERERQMLELALRGEIPAAVRKRIADGTATEEDMIELTGIISTLINRAVAKNTSIEKQVTLPAQITSVTRIESDGTTLADKIGYQPKLKDAVDNLLNGQYSKEFGLTNIEPDELAYASHYYSPAGIRAETGGFRSTPQGWDINKDLPYYESAGGHVFGNVTKKDSSGLEYDIADAVIPIDYGTDEESVVLTRYSPDKSRAQIQSTASPLVVEAETAEERIRRQYQEYAAGRVAARDALNAAADVAQQQIQKTCGSTCTATVVSKGTAAGVDEFQVIITTQGNDLNDTQKAAIAKAAELGVNVSDPAKKALVLTLLGDKTTEEFNKTLGDIAEQTKSVPNALDRLADDLIKGTNTVTTKACVLICFDVNVTERLRSSINDELKKGGQKTLSAEEMMVAIEKEAERLAQQQGGKQIAFADLSKEEQEKYLGIAVDELQVAQKKAQDEIYVAYEESRKGEDIGTPVVETATDNCGFICNGVMSMFGGVEGARHTLEKVVAASNPKKLCDCAVIEEENFGPSRPDAVNESYEEKMELALTPLQEKYPGLKFIAFSGTHEDPNYDPAKDDGHPSGRHAHGNGADGHFYIDGKLVTDKQTLNDIGQALALVDDNVGIGYSNKSGTFTHVDFEPKTKGTEWGYSGGFPTDIAKAVDAGRAGTQIADVSVQSYEEYKEEDVVLTTTDGKGGVGKPVLDLFNKMFPQKTTVVHTDGNTDDTKPSEGTTPTTPNTGTITTDKKLGEMVTGAMGAVGDFFSDLFGSITGKTGTGKTPVVTDSLTENNNDSNNNNDPDPVGEPEPELTIDLTAKATAPSQSNANEYRFKGDLTRVYSRDQSYAELQKYFSVTLENRLNIDYMCDGSVDAVKTFTIPYRTFAWSNNTSTVLLSEYMQIDTEGSHCFWFDVDTKNALKEVNENNNASNKYNFSI